MNRHLYRQGKKNFPNLDILRYVLNELDISILL